jgi:HEAT repeat protein
MRFAILLFALVAFAPQASAQKPEPRYKGKPLAYWVERLQKADTDAEQAAAAVAVGSFGTDAAAAVPKLIEMLDDRSPEFRQLVYHTLAALGPVAKGAVPDLIKMLKEKLPRNTQYAIWLIEKIGPDAKDAVPELVKFLDTKEYRDDAVDALSSIGPAAKDALPALRRVLLDAVSPEPTVCEVSPVTLCKLHRLGADAVPMLLDLISFGTQEGRIECVTALGHIGPGAAKAAPKLAEFLKHDDLKLRLEAAIALCRIEKNLKAVVVLAELLTEQSSLACPAAEALAEMGPDAKDALPALKAATMHKAPFVPKAARDAIKKIEAINPAKN